MTRRLRLALGVALALALASGGGATAGSDVVYGPPFDLGPAGGDQWNHVSADPAGRVTVGRVHPVPALIGCGAGAGYAHLQVVHPVSEPVSSITVHYAEALVDPYVFLSVGVTDEQGQWLGTAKQRGVIAGEGSVAVPFTSAGAGTPTHLTIRFGLEVASACPSADAGTVRFTQVVVHEAAQP